MRPRRQAVPSYYLHSSYIWQLARDARDRARDVVADNPDASAADAISAIILSAAAAEGFINELSELGIQKYPGHSIPASFEAFGQRIQELENERSSTLDKFLAAAPLLSSTKFEKGRNPFQDFSLLFDVRNMIIHVKAIDQSGPQDGEAATFTMPEKVRVLQGKGLAKQSVVGVGMSWCAALETDKMASWACETALNMILAVLDLIPESPGDPTSHFKCSFRNHKKRT
jgi:hypothetical protein